MMQRNEDRLLEFWFRHHAGLFGARNLFVFDNGSTHTGVLDTLERIASAGVTVVRDHDDHRSFREKGLVFLRYMARLRENGYRFFIPLDCDEFLALDGPDGPSIDPNAIYRELARSRRFVACRTSHCYLNHPREPGAYRRAPFNKVLGTFEGIDWLGEGFHRVRAPMESSRLSYLHHHYRPYDDFRDKAAAKIIAHERELTEPALREFAASADNDRHAAQEYLLGPEEYEAMFARQDYSAYAELRDWYLKHTRG